MFEEGLVDLPDDPLELVAIQADAVGILEDRVHWDRPAPGSSLGLEVAVGLPVDQELRLDVGRLDDMFGRLEASLLVGGDDTLRDLLVPDSELMIEDGRQFPAASASWILRKRSQ